MLKIASAAALLAMIAAPAVAQSQPQPATPAANTSQSKAAQAKQDNDRVVCEEQETIGTRLGAKKVCMTVAQWQEYRQNEKDQTARIQLETQIQGSH